MFTLYALHLAFLDYKKQLDLMKNGQITDSDKLDLLIDQVGRLTEVVTSGFTDLKATAERQAETAERQAAIAERQAAAIERQAAVAQSLAETVAKQAETVDRLIAQQEQS